MVDALDDDWWLEPVKPKKARTEENNKTSSSFNANDQQKIEGNKRKHETQDAKKNPKNEIIATKKKKKKRKIKNGPTADELLSSDSVLSFFRNATKKTLSPLELEDILPVDNDWFHDDKDHDAGLEQFSPFLNKMIPKWTKLRDRLKENHHGSPILFVLAVSARRAVELNRASNGFKGPTCRTSKLFAKHIKLEEQEAHLTKSMVHFGIGTPNRVLKLLQNGSLSLEKTKFVVIDWKYKDAKERTIIDLPEVKQDLLQLLQLFLFPKIKENKLKMGLF